MWLTAVQKHAGNGSISASYNTPSSVGQHNSTQNYSTRCKQGNTNGMDGVSKQTQHIATNGTTRKWSQVNRSKAAQQWMKSSLV